MRSRIFPAVGISAVALVAATAFAPIASAHNGASAVHHGSAGLAHYATSAKTCYSQGTSLDGSAVSSQNFETAFDAYDDMAADDFTVKKSCKIKTVDVAGQYSVAGPAVSATVTFYKDASGIPGAVIKSKKGKITADSAGTLTLSLGKKGVKLSKGTDWVSVQVNMDFGTSGQWYWDTASDGGGSAAQWQNPGGGFGICPTWGPITTCNGTVNSELSFSLS